MRTRVKIPDNFARPVYGADYVSFLTYYGKDGEDGHHVYFDGRHFELLFLWKFIEKSRGIVFSTFSVVFLLLF